MATEMKHCRVKKIEQLPDRPVGVGSGGEINTGYEVTGYLFDIPVIGKPLEMFRYKRNDIETIGLFKTSAIKEIEKSDNGITLKTQNSIYILTFIPDSP